MKPLKISIDSQGLRIQLRTATYEQALDLLERETARTRPRKRLVAACQKRLDALESEYSGPILAELDCLANEQA